MSQDQIAFHFDPRCPWCYQTSRWAVRLEELGKVQIDWRVFCLEIVNAPEGTDPYTIEATAGPALRTVMALRAEGHRDLVGAFYTALGAQTWDAAPPQSDPLAAAHAALATMGLDPALCDKALADDATWAQVVEEHGELVERTGSFGVPTIVLDGGNGPAIFGPVISELPSDEDSVELWHHVVWLARYENFAELKRGRMKLPDLAAVNWNAAQKKKAAEKTQ